MPCGSNRIVGAYKVSGHQVAAPLHSVRREAESTCKPSGRCRRRVKWSSRCAGRATRTAPARWAAADGERGALGPGRALSPLASSFADEKAYFRSQPIKIERFAQHIIGAEMADNA